MRLVMQYTWQGIAGGSRGEVKNARTDPKNKGTLFTVKFDYGETREVPKAATLPEITWDNQKLTAR